MSRLTELAAAGDPALAEYVVADPPEGRFAARDALSSEREFVLEAVHEGYLAHYGEPRAFSGMDPDLSLLAGDALYALGLERLAGTGDLEAVAALADLIAGCARAEAERRSDEIDALWKTTVGAMAE